MHVSICDMQCCMCQDVAKRGLRGGNLIMQIKLPTCGYTRWQVLKGLHWTDTGFQGIQSVSFWPGMAGRLLAGSLQ